MSDELKAPESAENKDQLSPEEQARVSAAISLSEAQARDDQAAIFVGQGPDKRETLAELISIRDRAQAPELIGGEPNEDFIPYRDCDRLLLAGTIVDIGGAPCRLLVDSPVMSAILKDEAVFAEYLSRTPGNLAANADGLRKRYNGNGRSVGDNEAHGLNKLLAEIAKLEAEIAADGAVLAEAAKSEEKAE